LVKIGFAVRAVYHPVPSGHVVFVPPVSSAPPLFQYSVTKCCELPQTGSVQIVAARRVEVGGEASTIFECGWRNVRICHALAEIVLARILPTNFGMLFSRTSGGDALDVVG
jgi:hypothetical protein